MKRSPYRDLGILLGITLILFYPLFYTHYFYTDEITHLVNYRKSSSFNMFVPQGRFLTDRLLRRLFSSIDTIRQITRIRLFSLLGWMACVPVWYTIFSRVCKKEELPSMIPFIATLYLIVSLPFCVYVSWASCSELFIANTCGLIAGYAIYSRVKYVPVTGSTDTRLELPAAAMAVALLSGIISLFTYQNGFGCFLLPFLLQVIAKKEWSRTLGVAIGTYFFTYLLYFAMFKLQMSFFNISATDRAGMATDPLNKIAWFFAKPLLCAFHFTWIVYEGSRAGKLFAVVFCSGWLLLSFYTLRPRSIFFRLRYLVGIFCLLGLSYLPSLIVKENYASNRTLLALDMTVFLLAFTTLLQIVRMDRHRYWLTTLLGAFFVAHAWYNFRYQFLRPVKTEYDLVRNYIVSQYHPGITSVDFIRPPQDLFQRKYGINFSWDEFEPSNYKQWVPDPFVRQVVLETTGSKAAADSLTIHNWPDKLAYRQVMDSTSSDTRALSASHTMTVDVEKIMQ